MKISSLFILIVGFQLITTNLLAQEKPSNENKIYQVKELLDDKFLDVKVKEYFVREIRKSQLVKAIDNHEFVHFFTDRYDKKIKPLIIDRLKGMVTITQADLTGFVNNEFMPALAGAFNQYRTNHPKVIDNSKSSNIKNVRHFELYDLGNRETNKGPGQPCNNADFENGNANGWDLSYGGVDPSATAPYSYINVNATTLAASPGQHTIMTGAGTDAIGGFPVVYPGGTSSLMLGDGTGTNNSAADASQTFMVDANSAAFSYSYAIVLMDPGHTVEQQPYFKVNMYDASGNPIQCGDYAVVAGGTALDPDFVPFTFGGENGVYMPWRTTFAPLQGYIGQNVTIEFVVGDCNQGAHFGYAYLDASCAPMEVLGPDTITCAGFPTISAPPGAASYLWTPTGETTQSIVATAPGHYTVAVTPVTGAMCAITLDKDIYQFIDTVKAAFNAVPTNICSGESISFTDQSTLVGIGAINGWEWDFDGNGTVDNTTQNPSHVYNIPGTYNVNLNVSSGVCEDDTIRQVVVVQGTTAIFSAPTVCVGLATDFTDASLGGVDTWGWDFNNDGIVDNTTQNPSYTFLTAGTYPVNLEVSIGGSCAHDTTINVIVTTSSTASFTAPSVCVGVATDFTDTSIGGVDTWGWDFNNDGIVDNSTQNPSYTFLTAGTYPVNLEVSVGGFCTHDTTINITVSTSSTAIFTATTVCTGIATDFTDTSVGGVDTWGWDFDNDGVVDNATQNPSYTFPSSGTFPVNLEVSVGGSCTHDTTINVTVNQSSTAIFTSTIVCLGVATDFTDTSVGGVDTWGWDFDNDGVVDNATQNPSYTFPSSGTFPVNLEVSVGGSCTHDTTINVTINQSSIAIFTAPTVCIGSQTNFTDASIGGVDTWGWDFDNDGVVDNATQNPSYTFPSSGTFLVNLEVSVGGSCLHDTTINVIVSQGSTAIFTSTVGCLGVATDFTDTSLGGVDTWGWDFDNDGVVDNATQNPSYTFLTAGIYPVNLEVSVGGACSHDTTINVTVSPKPTAAFTFSNVCFGTSTGFTDLSTGNGGTINQWGWDFTNNGSVDIITQNPTNGYSSAGNFTVELLVTTTAGCKDSTTLLIVVDPIPVASFSATPECLENTTTFTNNSTITTGTITLNDWDFGDVVGTSTLLNPTYLYISSGIYNVTLTVTSDSGCTHTVIVPVTVNPKPTADFDTTDVCLNVAAQFTDQSIGNGGVINGWTWDFENDGTTDNLTQNPAHFYPAAGTYTIELIASTTNGCKDTIIKTVTIHPMPIADFTYVNACFEQDIVFTNTSTVTAGTVDAWAWSFGDAQTSAIEDPLHNYASENVYNVQLIVTTNNSCKDTIVKNGIEVWPLPVVDFIPTTVCLNDITQFQDQSTISNLYTLNTNDVFNWNFDDGTVLFNTQNPIHIYTTEGVFQATLIVTTNHNCVDTIIKSVTVNPLPVVDFTPNIIEGCTPVCVTFTDNTTISSGNVAFWDWDYTSDGIKDASNQNPTKCFVNPSHSSVRDFDIRLIATSNFGCKDTLIKTDYIHSYPIPLASFTYWPNDEASIVDNDITFTDQSIIAATWNWNLGDGTLTNIQNPVHEFADTGFYLVTLAIENVYGCRDTTQKYVNIKPIYAIYIPNSFTPDGDFINDYFYVNGYGIKELQMMIFDRWGMKLYDDIGVEQSWDGFYKGNLVPTDVYVYKVRAKDVFDEWHDYIGKVTVVR